MALPTFYAVGTASVANGATTITFSGALLGSEDAPNFQPGDLFLDPAQPLVPPQRIESIDYDAETAELWVNWPGTSMTSDPYEVRYIGDPVRSTAQTRRLLEQMRVIEANGRGLFYTFTDAITDTDHGPGVIALNHATIGSATAAYLDNLDANGATVSTILDTWDDSTSTTKGQLWVRGIENPAAFHAFNVTGSVVDGTGYRKLTLTYVGGSGTFAVDDELMVFFSSTGAKGDAGTNGTNGADGVFSAIASQAEARAGTNNTNGMTPLRVAEEAGVFARVKPQGRLTLTTAVPVLTSDVTAATSIYYTPYEGDLCPIYDGTAFIPCVFTELTLALDNDSGHTGYHQSGKNFDLFVINDGGTIRLATGPAWSSDTARGTGAGTTELERKNGLLTNKVSITARFGSASGDTVSVSANRATYVGTFRASANGQTQVKFGGAANGGSEAWVGLWNQFCRVVTALCVIDNTTYTYNGGLRSAHNSTANRVSCVRGQNEDGVKATLAASQLATSNSSTSAGVGIGLDSTSAAATNSVIAYYNGGTTGGAPGCATFDGLLGLGFHFLQGLDVCNGATGTFVANLALGAALRW